MLGANKAERPTPELSKAIPVQNLEFSSCMDIMGSFCLTTSFLYSLIASPPNASPKAKNIGATMYEGNLNASI